MIGSNHLKKLISNGNPTSGKPSIILSMEMIMLMLGKPFLEDHS